MDHSVGQLVKYRNRDWIVQPSPKDEEDILLLRPLGGAEIEEVGIFKPLINQLKLVSNSVLALPKVHTGNSLQHARLLYEANRLSFRQASGPIRSVAKLSFKPRAYQLVPLVLALRQLEQEKPLRLLIADDVGVGKTVEALMIVSEMLERRLIKSVAILCPPHLCDQWQLEILAKTGKEAAIVRSSSFKQLEHQLPAGRTLWQHYPLTVVSLDFVKQRDRIGLFATQAPDLVVVDEVHTCAKPDGVKSNRQQRHELLQQLMKGRKAAEQHLLLMTATPHSGKEEEFKSILGLMDPSFTALDLGKTADQARLAPHFVQRKRNDLQVWLEGNDRFPQRKTDKLAYPIKATDYETFYNILIAYTKSVAWRVTTDGNATITEKMKFWAALALMRGALSSPAAAVKMLQNRLDKLNQNDDDFAIQDAQNTQLADDDQLSFTDYTDGSDQEEIQLMNFSMAQNDSSKLSELLQESKQIMDAMAAIGKFSKRTYQSVPDPKVGLLIKELALLDERNKLGRNFRPMVFCTYISTAQYLGKMIMQAFPDKNVVVVTSELADQDRKQRIEGIEATEPNYILIATDCLSEGINLQDKFNTVIHYDLPWNPNRIEQREGRVDRFGQEADEVLTKTIYSEDSIVDKRIMMVLIDKIINIRSTTGGSLPILDTEVSLRDQLLLDLTQSKTEQEAAGQQKLFESEVDQYEKDALKAVERIKSVYSHNKNLEPADLKHEIATIDHSIGTPAVVEWLTLTGLRFMGFEVTGPTGSKQKHYVIRQTSVQNAAFAGVSAEIRKLVGKNYTAKVSFESPTPAGFTYLGRNHPLVATIAQTLLKHGLAPVEGFVGLRTVVIRTTQVTSVTTVIMARMRNVIYKQQKGKKEKEQYVAEEMYLCGFNRLADMDYNWLDDATCTQLMDEANQTGANTSSINPAIATQQLNNALEAIQSTEVKAHLNQLAADRSKLLASSHGRLGKALSTVYEPELKAIIPPDVMGFYVFLPETKVPK